MVSKTKSTQKDKSNSKSKVKNQRKVSIQYPSILNALLLHMNNESILRLFKVQKQLYRQKPVQNARSRLKEKVKMSQKKKTKSCISCGNNLNSNNNCGCNSGNNNNMCRRCRSYGNYYNNNYSN